MKDSTREFIRSLLAINEDVAPTPWLRMRVAEEMRSKKPVQGSRAYRAYLREVAVYHVEKLNSTEAFNRGQS